MDKVVLYTYWRSSSAYRVRIALAAKGISYDPVFVNLLKGEQRDPEYVKMSPRGRVPLLVIDGEELVESVAICELLEEIRPTPALLPKDPYDRAHVRALVELVNAGIQPLQNLEVLAHFDGDDARKKFAASFIDKGLRAFDAKMAERADEGPYVFGDSFGLGDVFLVPQIMGALRFGVDLGPMPHVRRAYEKAKEHPAVIAALPETQPDAPKT